MKKKIIAIIVIAVLILVGYNIATTTDFGEFTNTFNQLTATDSVNNENDELEAVTVSYVVDGDTLVVAFENGKEDRVRLIGVDTPESVNPDESKNTEEGKIASEYTKMQIKEGQTVYLQYDEEKNDKYDRILAYVWLKEDIDVNNKDDIREYMYNAQLLIEGYAKTMSIEPNTKYKSLFKTFEYESKIENRGMWSDKNFYSLFVFSPSFFEVLKVCNFRLVQRV